MDIEIGDYVRTKSGIGKVEQMIYHGFREININEEEYNKLKQETKNLIKLNNIKVNIIKV